MSMTDHPTTSESTSHNIAEEVVVIVVLLRHDGAALLQLRDQKPGLRNAGMWVVPGGHGEPGESLEASARRELREETAYACGELHRLMSYEVDGQEDWPPYTVVAFWTHYDGIQPLRCGEGQTLRFVGRSEAEAYRIPQHLFPVWDAALVALKQHAATTAAPAPATWTVPYAALGQQAMAMKDQWLAAVERVLLRGAYILGPEVSAFEEEFARFCGTSYAVGVGSGTSALSLVFRWLDLGPRDEVITVPNSFVASAASIAMTGARVVFVDIGADLNMDPDRLASAITPRTKVIMPVHLTGRPAQMPRILEIAKHHGLFVLEDAAQAVGAVLEGRPVGSWGDAGCFSFHPLKNLHAIGDGGAITTNNQSLCEWLLKARNHGLRTRDECQFWSVNSRLDELHAAILRIQLLQLPSWTESRRRLAARYNDLLRPSVQVPEEGPGEFCVYQTYMAQADRRGRDALVRWLREQGIEAVVHYPVPLHLQPAARELGYSADDFPVAMQAAGRIVSLPLYPELSQAQQDRVVELIASFYRSEQRGR
jgi:dTDP-4-amino-4,6-dideoxygalactose transaminase/8-oxo-dGTP pyrophosphatase MutT (NUDIX family)